MTAGSGLVDLYVQKRGGKVVQTCEDADLTDMVRFMIEDMMENPSQSRRRRRFPTV